MLIRERGRLVEKDRFFEEVWKDVVVRDSALTQCIKEIRKELGDDASNPRCIQTVPRHGYRFIGAAEPVARQRLGSGSPRREESPGAPQAGAVAGALIPLAGRQSRFLGESFAQSRLLQLDRLGPLFGELHFAP